MNDLLSRRAAEESPEVRRELTRTLIAHRLSCNGDASLFGSEEPPSFKEPQVLLILDRRTTRERMKVPSKSSGRHMYGTRKRIGFNVLAVMVPNEIHRGHDAPRPGS